MLQSFTRALRRLTKRNVCQIHGFLSAMIYLIFLIYVPFIHSVSHMLITTYTETNGQTVAGIPEVSAVTTLDKQQIDYYNTVIKKLIPKQDWMKEFASTDKLKKYTEIRERVQQINKLNIIVLTQQFNQTSGVHKYERVYGCDWDDETGDRRGFDEYSYDGESFISLDLKEIRYTASVPQAEPTVEKWNEDRERLAYLKRYYRDECVDWLKTLLYFSKASSEKTGTVPESTEPSLREPAMNDKKSDGSASYTSYITPAAAVIFLVLLILIALYVLQNNWKQLKRNFKNYIYKKEDESDEQNQSTESLTSPQEEGSSQPYPRNNHF